MIKRLGFSAPFTSQKEADDAFQFLVDTTVKVMGLDRNEAERRVNGLFDSGILRGDPNSVITQKSIDAFLAIPSSRYHHINN